MATKDYKVVTITVDNVKTHVMENAVDMGTLLTFHANVLQYMSSEALLNLMDKTADTLIEIGLAVKQANTAKDMVDSMRHRKDIQIGRYSWLHEIPSFREHLLGIICEYILRSDGMGRLHGFHYITCESNEGSVATSGSKGNPEMKTMRYMESLEAK